MMKRPLRVAVTDASNAVSKLFLYKLAVGHVFGKTQEVIIQALETEEKKHVVQGMKIILEDSIMPLVQGFYISSHPEIAFQDADVIILLESIPHEMFCSSKDWEGANALIYKKHGEMIAQRASPDVRVIVAGAPECLMVMVLLHYCPWLPPSNVTALSRHWENMARGHLASILKVPFSSIQDVVVWGKISGTTAIDIRQATVQIPGEERRIRLHQAVDNDKWLKTEFSKMMRRRTREAILQHDMVLSIAHALSDHAYELWFGLQNRKITSMAVYLDEDVYNIPAGMVFSMPVTIKDRVASIVKNLDVDPYVWNRMYTTVKEMQMGFVNCIDACEGRITVEERNEDSLILVTKYASSEMVFVD